MPWPPQRLPHREGLAKRASREIEAIRGPAEDGDAEAQCRLGRIYAARHLGNNPREALKWLRRAAEQGHAGAQKSLGLMYALANGVPQDYIEAYKWLTIADRSRRWRFVRSEAQKLAKRMNQGQIATGELLAHTWRPKLERPAAAPTIARRD